MRTLVQALVLSSVVAASGTAWACGSFTVSDPELERTFTFQAESVRLARGAEPDTVLFRLRAASARSLALLQGDLVAASVEGEVVRVRGARAGTVAPGLLRLGEQAYTVEAAHLPSESPSALDLRYRVLAGGKLLFAGKARSFVGCEGERPTPSEQLPELRGRLALFLVWRQLLRPARLPLR